MYALKNRVTLIGNVGNPPEVRLTENQKKLVRFSIATNDSYKNSQGEKVTSTTWHSVVAWNTLAEIVEKYVNKGTELAIEGKLINRNYTDTDGNKKYVSEIHLTELLLLGSKAS